MDCDDIEHLVNLLGTIELLAAVSGCENVVVMERGTDNYLANKGNFRNKRDGLYFDGSHWYSVKDEKQSDSYTEGYQLPGTAHFCQTFALMIFMGEVSELSRGKYAENIRAAMQFWQDVFTDDFDLTTWLTDQWEDGTITNPAFMSLLLEVASNADSLVGCTHG